MSDRYEIKNITLSFNPDGTPVTANTLEGPGLYPPALRALCGDKPSDKMLRDLKNVVDSVYWAAYEQARKDIREALGLRVRANGDIAVRR